MGLRIAGMISELSDANQAAGHLMELNPGGVIELKEFSLSFNAAPDSTVVPVNCTVHRTSTVGTGGGAITPVPMDCVSTIVTAARSKDTTPGTNVETLHQFFVAVVSGMIWVTGPAREFNCIAAEFIALRNIAALGASINCASNLVFEE